MLATKAGAEAEARAKAEARAEAELKNQDEDSTRAKPAWATRLYEVVRSLCKNISREIIFLETVFSTGIRKQRTIIKCGSMIFMHVWSLHCEGGMFTASQHREPLNSDCTGPRQDEELCMLYVQRYNIQFNSCFHYMGLHHHVHGPTQCTVFPHQNLLKYTFLYHL